jgi:hypothetical protein
VARDGDSDLDERGAGREADDPRSPPPVPPEARSAWVGAGDGDRRSGGEDELGFGLDDEAYVYVTIPLSGGWTGGAGDGARGALYGCAGRGAVTKVAGDDGRGGRFPVAAVVVEVVGRTAIAAEGAAVVLDVVVSTAAAAATEATPVERSVEINDSDETTSSELEANVSSADFTMTFLLEAAACGGGVSFRTGLKRRVMNNNDIKTPPPAHNAHCGRHVSASIVVVNAWVARLDACFIF